MTRNVFVFPGQGSQFIGMGQDLYDNFAEAKAVFQEVDDALDQHLSKLIFSGEEKDLNLTENTQPALMTVSQAVIAVLQGQGRFDLQKNLSYVAGHSLGEYSALTAVGALELADTARLLKLRGQAMQRAVPVGEGAMAAIIGLSFSDVDQIVHEAAKTETCEAANDNSDGQTVISGHAQAVERAIEVAKEKGAKRALPLPVSAPFHCSLMAPAAQEMATALADTTIRPPEVPVICNVTARPEEDPNTLRRLLVDQITGTVRWRESVEFMAEDGVTNTFEVGAGKVLTGLVRRIAPDIQTANIGTAEQIESFLNG